LPTYNLLPMKGTPWNTERKAMESRMHHKKRSEARN